MGKKEIGRKGKDRINKEIRKDEKMEGLKNGKEGVKKGKNGEMKSWEGRKLKDG